ncbi:MAG: prolyl oligopeptidase family serine peptidase [Myxococcota bacterium]|nr:prolyl oligopeptidase family serine peptidase [Myxococcota bacterium]
MTHLLLSILLAASPAGWASDPAEAPAQRSYPDARRGDVIDSYFGTDVPDPYRWMEEPDSPETREWVDAQVALTTEHLRGIPRREAIKERLTTLWNYERFSSPSKRGDRYFFWHNNGLQNHSVLYSSESLDGSATAVLDPNTLSDDGTVSVSMTAFSDDGALMAYGTSDGGSDWQTIHIRDVLSGRDLTETLKWVKFSGASWTHDNNGFFYSRYPEPEQKLESVNEHQKLYYHQIGTLQETDRLIYEEPESPKVGFSGSVNESGDTLFIYGWEGTDDRNTLYTLDLTDPDAEVVKLFPNRDASYEIIGDTVIRDERGWLQRLFGPKRAAPETRYWIKTNHSAPNGRVVAVNPAHPEPEHWVEVVPESKHVLRGVSMVGGRLFVNHLEDVHSVVHVHDLEGNRISKVPLPGIGTAYGFGGKSTDDETFYSFTGFSSPPTIHRYTVSTGQSRVWKASKVEFNPDDLEVSQQFYTSKDGTKVPMFVMHKKGLKLDGQNPTILYGYGGFNISLTPGFSMSRVVWLEMGGVYAIANLRGGGEYGEDWHKAGTKQNKQNVFDDFISGAEHLIDAGYTSPEFLGIMGGSNGGLLVGAVMTQRPELFGAAVPSVGVLDMLRYHKFTIGWAWADDYGTSEESAEMFAYLKGYSPVHNVAEGTVYPDTLIVTADHDDRVVPAHSYKFAAELQRNHGGDNPVLIRIETRAGHGGGTPMTKRIEQLADQYAFLVRALGMESAEERAPAEAAEAIE